jgi:hypothetical protein
MEDDVIKRRRKRFDPTNIELSSVIIITTPQRERKKKRDKHTKKRKQSNKFLRENFFEFLQIPKFVSFSFLLHFLIFFPTLLIFYNNKV